MADKKQSVGGEDRDPREEAEYRKLVAWTDEMEADYQQMKRARAERRDRGLGGDDQVRD